MQPSVLPPKTPAEVVAVRFDYSSLVTPGENIVSAIVNTELFSGVDTNDSFDASTPSISTTSSLVTALISGGSDDCVYRVECLAQCTDGQVLALIGTIGIIEFDSEIPPPPVSGTFITTQSGQLIAIQGGGLLVLN